MAVYQDLSLTQLEQNREENTSRVGILWRSTQTGGSYNMTERLASFAVAVNGETILEQTVNYVLPMQSTAVILDQVITVPHNHKGEAVVTVTTEMDTHISAGVVRLSKTLNLDTIPRAGSLRVSDGVIGGNVKIAVGKTNSSFGHSIACRFGGISGFLTPDGGLEQEEVIFTEDSVDFLVPLEFYREIPNAQSGQCFLQLQTYHGETPVGDVQEAVFTVVVDETVCRPAVSGFVVDGNERTRELTGDDSILVRFMSEGVCTLQAEAKHGASILKKQIAGQSAEEDQIRISGFEQERVTFSVTDSRGYTEEYVHSCEVIPYIKLSVDATAQRQDAGGQAMVYISGDCYGGSFGASHNLLTVEVSVDGGESFVAEATVSENRYYAFAELENMDYTRVYGITVRVRDSLMQVEKRVILKKSVPVFDWGEGDFAFHVPVQLDDPLSLESGGTGCGTWENSGIVVKEKDTAGLTTVEFSPGAFCVGADGTPQFSCLPLESGGTGAETALGAAENLGLILQMEPGMEYATYRRWNGQVVYTMLLDFGAMPNNGAKAVAHHANASRILQCCGSTSQGKTLPYGGKHVYCMDVFCDPENVYIDTELDCSDQTAMVQIWYIK